MVAHILKLSLCLVASMFLLAVNNAIAASRCFGSVGSGRIEASVKLPASGKNYTAYSVMGAALGRTYVHDRVHTVVIDAFRRLESLRPDTRYVYGETGWESGGRFRPHRTHQNGLSVDFFVPVRDKSGASVPLPTSVTNKFGYDINFDREGRFDGLSIDFEAVAEHLMALHKSAVANGIDLALVIFDPPYLSKLFSTPHGAYLRKHIRFMQGNAWVRHDEHYHVDFKVPCAPLAASK